MLLIFELNMVEGWQLEFGIYLFVQILTINKLHSSLIHIFTQVQTKLGHE